MALAVCGQTVPPKPADASPAETPSASTGAPALEALSEQARQAFEKSHRAVVRITASDDHGRLAGTGFLVDLDGTIFTAWSVIADNTDIEVHFDGKK